MKKTESGELILKFIEVHGNKYDYSHVIYKNMRTKIIIECPIHGLFEQCPTHHLRGSGCRKCANQIINVNNGKSFTQQEFIEIVSQKEIPNISFEKSVYQGKRKDIVVTCSIHGDYITKAEILLKGNGCKKCASEKLKINRIKSTSDFIQESKNIHGELYDYNYVNYTGAFNKVNIICKFHSKMFYQTPSIHLRGSGCPLCNTSKGEEFIRNILNNIGINFTTQKTFDDLIYQRKLKFDFYLTEYNACIEYDGEQHFREFNKYWGGTEGFQNRIRKDTLKNKYCELNGIKLLRIRFDNLNIEDTVINFINDLKNP